MKVGDERGILFSTYSKLARYSLWSYRTFKESKLHPGLKTVPSYGLNLYLLDVQNIIDEIGGLGFQNADKNTLDALQEDPLPLPYIDWLCGEWRFPLVLHSWLMLEVIFGQTALDELHRRGMTTDAVPTDDATRKNLDNWLLSRVAEQDVPMRPIVRRTTPKFSPSSAPLTSSDSA